LSRIGSGDEGLVRFLVRGSAIAVVTRMVGVGLGYVAAIIISRLLGAQGYGTYSIAMAWALLLVVPSRAGLDAAALKFAPIYLERRDRSRLVGFVRFSASCVLASSALAGTAVILVASLGLTSIPRGASIATATIIFPIAALGLVGSMLRAERRILASQFYEQVLRPAVTIMLLLAVVVLARPITASIAVLFGAAGAFVALLAGAVHAGRALPLSGTEADYSQWRQWLSLGGVLLATTVVQEALNQVDIVMLGYLASTTEAGLFAAAWRVASLASFAVAALSTVSGPLIASYYEKGEYGPLSSIAHSTARIGFVAALLICFPLAILGEPILKLFGPDFPAAYPALLVLLFGGLANAFTGSVAYLMTMTGRHSHALSIFAGALAVSIVLNLLLIPHYSFVGAAIASTAGTVAWNVAMLAYVRRAMGIDASAMALAPR
jgi:O-antigen/teichoic acid export membrane protein